MLLVISSIFSLVGYCQEIAFGVLVPDEEQGFSKAQSTMLQNRLEELCNRNGVAVVNNPDGFFLYPSISIISDDVAESGMQNIYSVKAEITVSVKQIGGAMVASVSKTYKGAGRSKEQAMTSLVQSFNTSDAIFSKFMSEAKVAVVKYYHTHCVQIMTKAEQYTATNDYRAAIATLYQIPSMTPCYSTVGEKMRAYYNLYQTQLCKTVEMSVASAMATHDYIGAVSLLAEIDPSSECYNYATEQFKKIEKEVAKIEKRDWDFKMRQYNDAVAIEKRWIDVASEVTKAYYSTRPTVHYTQVIR